LQRKGHRHHRPPGSRQMLPDRRPAAPPTDHDRPERPPAVPAAGDVLPVQAAVPAWPAS